MFPAASYNPPAEFMFKASLPIFDICETASKLAPRVLRTLWTGHEQVRCCGHVQVTLAFLTFGCNADRHGESPHLISALGRCKSKVANASFWLVRRRSIQLVRSEQCFSQFHNLWP